MRDGGGLCTAVFSFSSAQRCRAGKWQSEGKRGSIELGEAGTYGVLAGRGRVEAVCH